MDTDDDSFSDLYELEFGSNPLDPGSIPIHLVPSVGPLGLSLAVGLMLLAARRTLRRQPR